MTRTVLALALVASLALACFGSDDDAPAARWTCSDGYVTCPGADIRLTDPTRSVTICTWSCASYGGYDGGVTAEIGASCGSEVTVGDGC